MFSNVLEVLLLVAVTLVMTALDIDRTYPFGNLDTQLTSKFSKPDGQSPFSYQRKVKSCLHLPPMHREWFPNGPCMAWSMEQNHRFDLADVHQF